MTGRRPKPNALKKAEGKPGKRKKNRAEPKFGGALSCPSWLTLPAKNEWARVTAELKALDLLQSTDRAALAAYCLAWARWKSAEEIVTREGQTVEEPILDKQREIIGQTVKRHPATIIAKDERAGMLRAASLFGFDPSSRSRLTVGTTAEQTDPFEAFMKNLDGRAAPTQ